MPAGTKWRPEQLRRRRQSRSKEPPAGGVTAKKRLPLFWRWRRLKPKPIAGGGNARADGPRGGRGQRQGAGAEGVAHGGATGRASQRLQAGAGPPADATPEENSWREPLGHGEPKASRKAQAERLPLTEQKVRTFCGVWTAFGCHPFVSLIFIGTDFKGKGGKKGEFEGEKGGKTAGRKKAFGL